jgi:hypothetical protein
MKILLHVGAEKTGSTSIQKNFLIGCKNIDIYYPKDYELHGSYYGNHMGLSILSGSEKAWKSLRSIVSPLCQQDAIERIRHDLSHITKIGSEYLFLSNEHLSSRLNAQDAVRLTEELQIYGNSGALLLIVREQAEALLSLYLNRIRCGERRYIIKWLADFPHPLTFDYQYIVETWRSAGWKVDVHQYQDANSISAATHFLRENTGLDDLLHDTNDKQIKAANSSSNVVNHLAAMAVNYLPESRVKRTLRNRSLQLPLKDLCKLRAKWLAACRRETETRYEKSNAWLRNKYPHLASFATSYE